MTLGEDGAVAVEKMEASEVIQEVCTRERKREEGEEEQWFTAVAVYLAGARRTGADAEVKLGGLAARLEWGVRGKEAGLGLLRATRMPRRLRAWWSGGVGVVRWWPRARGNRREVGDGADEWGRGSTCQ